MKKLALFLCLAMLKVVICEAQPVRLDLVARIESSGNPLAYNRRSGARGLYQVTEVCLADYNAYNSLKITKNDLFIPARAKIVAEWYLYKRIPQLLKHFGLEVSAENVLWAYNAGIGQVVKGRKPAETVDYIRKYNKMASGH